MLLDIIIINSTDIIINVIDIVIINVTNTIYQQY